jgi:4-hydroxy-tetrahydrodipicolinate reductase
MKVSLVGYGKMGKELEKILIERGHTIQCIVDVDNNKDLQSDTFKESDVAIEFSRPESAYDNIIACINAGVPVVSGTTGWLDKKKNLDDYCIVNNGTYMYSSNYSIGVNIFFAINRQLAKLMDSHQNYRCKVTEIHHTTKLDAPSGTGITLAQDILKNHRIYDNWSNEESEDNHTLSIISERIKDAPGTHIIEYRSEVDEIVITHEAKSRKGFAMGAVIASEWIKDKKGVFSMSDILGI